MGTPTAPRIDARLRQYIAGADARATAAEVTRAVGDLAWQLGFTRPSYQQVRVLLRRAGVRPVPASGSSTSAGRVFLHHLVRAVDVLYEYPAPGLAGWYERYKHGP